VGEWLETIGKDGGALDGEIEAAIYGCGDGEIAARLHKVTCVGVKRIRVGGFVVSWSGRFICTNGGLAIDLDSPEVYILAVVCG